MSELDRAFLSPKHFSTSIEIAGRTYEIELETPSLLDCSYSVWGDWGPMYTFELEEPASVRLRYRCEAESIEGELAVGGETIRLYSPTLWAERQRTPFYLGFTDAALGLEFAGFLDRRGAPTSLSVKIKGPEDQIAALLSGDRPLQDAGYPGSEELRVA